MTSSVHLGSFVLPIVLYDMDWGVVASVGVLSIFFLDGNAQCIAIGRVRARRISAGVAERCSSVGSLLWWVRERGRGERYFHEDVKLWRDVEVGDGWREGEMWV